MPTGTPPDDASLEGTAEQIDSGADDSGPSQQRLVVFVAHGEASDRAMEVPPAGLTVGRGSDATVVLDDERVSRLHLRIRAVGGGWRAQDLGSKNGGYLDGAPFPSGGEVAVSAGSIVRVGETVMVLGAGAARDGGAEDPRFPGASRAAEEVRQRLSALTQTIGPVLVQGETGTGKERAALSLVPPGVPLVVLNAAQLKSQLAADELFGHAAGAFTGATTRRLGAVALADGGGLFLDEIGDLPLDTQAELLRFLEDGGYRALGANDLERSSARVVAATNVDLERAVAEGRFRRDLVARLRASNRPVELPPLRERREDVMAWARVFLAQVRPEMARAELWTAGAVECVLLHDWRENLRELKGVMRGLVEVERAYPITATDLPPALRQRRRERRAKVRAEELRTAPEEAVPSRERVVAALEVAGGRMRSAAAALALDRRTLYRLCEKMSIDYASFRRSGGE